jgi:hypothetical protein
MGHQKVVVDSVQVLMFNRQVRIHTSDIKFHKQNFRWETSSQALGSKMKKATF